MGQKELIEIIEQNPGIYQCDLVELHGYNGSLIKKMALRGDIIREIAIAPGRQNKTYKIWTAEQKNILKLVDRYEAIAEKYPEASQYEAGRNKANTQESEHDSRTAEVMICKTI